MKRILICVLLISSVLFVISCATKTATGKTAETSVSSDFRYKPSASHSYLTEENIGDEIVIKGKIVKNGNNFVLLENPDSKNRVSFALEFEDESLKEKLTASGIVQISGVLTSSESPWTKGMKVLKVE